MVEQDGKGSGAIESASRRELIMFIWLGISRLVYGVAAVRTACVDWSSNLRDDESKARIKAVRWLKFRSLDWLVDDFNFSAGFQFLRRRTHAEFFKCHHLSGNNGINYVYGTVLKDFLRRIYIRFLFLLIFQSILQFFSKIFILLLFTIELKGNMLSILAFFFHLMLFISFLFVIERYVEIFLKALFSFLFYCSLLFSYCFILMLFSNSFSSFILCCSSFYANSICKV